MCVWCRVVALSSGRARHVPAGAPAAPKVECWRNAQDRAPYSLAAARSARPRDLTDLFSPLPVCSCSVRFSLPNKHLLSHLWRRQTTRSNISQWRKGANRRVREIHRRVSTSSVRAQSGPSSQPSAAENGLGDDAAFDATLASYPDQFDNVGRIRNEAGQELQEQFRGVHDSGPNETGRANQDG